MSEAVKTRDYNSPRRRAQAAATRLEILGAARSLFERDGYAATSMPAIAAEAGVAVKTVYKALETKSGVLHAVWDLCLKGSDDTVPVAAHEWYREMLEEPDPVRQLALNARNSRRGKERVSGIASVIRDAALGDPAISALWQTIQREYHANQKVVVESLAAKTDLLGDVDRSADVLWTLNHPNTWEMLVAVRGWSPDDYEEWATRTACTLLLK